jgi:putative flippase GtrA
VSLIQQAIRFGLVGIVNTAIGLASIYGLMFFLRTDPATANALGYGVGLATSFLLNRIWTFKSSRPLGKALPRFLMVAAASYMLNLGVVMGGIALFDANPYIMQLVGVGIYTLVMFFACRWLVFPSNIDACVQQDR